MANKDRPSGFRAVANLGGGAIPMYPAVVASNVSLAPGDAIIMTSNGRVTIATASSTGILGVCQSAITAVAATLQNILYVPAQDGIVFEGQCSGTFTPVNCGESVDIEGTTGIMEINEDAQSVGCARLLRLADGLDNANGANARVQFTWAKSQWHGQA